MVNRSENGAFGASCLQGHGPSAGSEVLGLSSRVPRAASSLRRQSNEPVVARYAPTKTATLTLLVHGWPLTRRSVSPTRTPACVVVKRGDIG